MKRNTYQLPQRPVVRQALILLFAMVLITPVGWGPAVPKAYACYTWSVGQRVGLKQGTEIRTGEGFGSRVQYVVEEENWQVDIINGPRKVDGQQWWDVSRRNLDGGGTGWVYFAQAAYDICPPPAKLVLVQDLSVSTNSPAVKQEVVGSYKVKNVGGQAITLDYLGIQGRLNGDLNGTVSDFAWVQNLTLQPNDEYTYAASRSFDVAGSWRLSPNYKPAGGNWSDVHRDNGTINGVWINVQQSRQLELIDNLSLQSDGSGAWPPHPGDKLMAHIRVRNNGDRSLHVEHIGVRGRRNGSEVWDIGFWTLDLSGNQEWTLDPNNERPLEPGNYSFRVSYQADGKWNEIGNEVRFTVAQPQVPIDAVEVMGQSGPITAIAGTTVHVSLELRNNGTTVWRDADNYGLYAIDRSLGAQPKIQIGPDVLPGQIRRWDIILTVPSVPTSSTWQLRHNGNAFGAPVSFQIIHPAGGSNSGDVKDILKLRLASGIQLSSSTPTVNRTIEATYTIRNPTDRSITVPYLGIAGRSPTGREYSNDASFGWLEYTTIPAKSDYTVKVHQTFSVPGPYAFYPALRLSGSNFPYAVNNDGVGGEPWLRSSVLTYANITDSASRPLAQCKVSWGFATEQVPWRTNASDVISTRCTNIRYDPSSDTMTVDLEIENKLQTVLERRFEAANGVTDTFNSLRDNSNKFIFPSSPWPALPWYKPSRQVIKDVTFQRGGVLKLSAWRNTHNPSAYYIGASALDLTALLGLDSHVGNTISDNEEPVRDLLVMIIDKVARTDAGLINNGLGVILDPRNKSADPIGLTLKMLQAMKSISDIRDLAPQVHYFYVKSGTPGASSLTVSEIVKKAQGFVRNIRLIGWFNDILTAPTAAELTISPTTNLSGSAIANQLASQSTLATALADNRDDVVLGNMVASGSGEHAPGNELFRLIDGDHTTGWTAETSALEKAWVTLQLANGAPVLVNELRIDPGPTNGNPVDAALKDFHIDVSVDNVSYHRLLNGSFTLSEIGKPKSFHFDRPVLAQYVRLTVDTNQNLSTTSFVNVAELQVFGQVGIPGDIYEGDNQVAGAQWMLTDGTAVTHNINYADDADWLRFAALAGTPYILTTSNLGSGIDTVLELYDQDGSRLLATNDNYGSGSASQIRWTPGLEGVYYLKVRQASDDKYASDCWYDVSILANGRQVYLPTVQRFDYRTELMS